MNRLMRWKLARVRFLYQRGDTYIRLTPNFGFGVPWFRKGNRIRRLRFALHHGLQIVEWRGARWVVTKQLLGKSKVNKEAIFLDRHNRR